MHQISNGAITSLLLLGSLSTSGFSILIFSQGKVPASQQGKKKIIVLMHVMLRAYPNRVSQGYLLV